MSKIDRLGWADGFVFSSFGHRIGIRVSDPAVISDVRRRLPPGWTESSRARVDCLYSLVAGGADGRRRRFSLLYRESQRIARNLDLEQVLEILEEDVKLHVAAAAPNRVFVHAGVVSLRGRAIVLPGRSLAGKSTLVDALARLGAKYYSDEYAVLDSHGRVHPYARPIKLRSSENKANASAASEVKTGKSPIPVGLVALTHYQPGATWHHDDLTPGNAVLAMMEHTATVRRRPQATMQALCAVAADAKLIQGQRGECDDAVQHLLAQASW